MMHPSDWVQSAGQGGWKTTKDGKKGPLTEAAQMLSDATTPNYVESAPVPSAQYPYVKGRDAGSRGPTTLQAPPEVTAWDNNPYLQMANRAADARNNSHYIEPMLPGEGNTFAPVQVEAGPEDFQDSMQAALRKAMGGGAHADEVLARTRGLDPSQIKIAPLPPVNAEADAARQMLEDKARRKAAIDAQMEAFIAANSPKVSYSGYHPSDATNVSMPYVPVANPDAVSPVLQGLAWERTKPMFQQLRPSVSAPVNNSPVGRRIPIYAALDWMRGLLSPDEVPEPRPRNVRLRRREEDDNEYRSRYNMKRMYASEDAPE